jgi:glycosyltransferase involved in cell wall biosynthesis
MRIVLATVCFPPAWRGGGSVRSIGNWARGLSRAGANVRVVTTDAFLTRGERPPRERVDEGFAVTTLRTPAWLGRRANRYGLAPALLPTLLRETRHADVCLAQGVWTWPLALTSRICRHRRLPYVVCTHGSLEARSLSEKAAKKRFYMRLVEKGTIRGAAAILFTSEAEHQRSRPVMGNAPAIVLPNALDPQPRRMPPGGFLHDRLGIDRRRRIVGMSGRIHPRKGFDVMVPALAHSDPNFHLVAFGPDDGFAAAVRRLARDCGTQDRVHLLGHLEGSELQDVYASLDLLVLPSSGESFGNVVLEALAQGTEVMVSSEVPLAGYVEGHRLGTVIPELSSAAWSQALNDWAGGGEPFDSIRAVHRVREDFDVDSIGRRCLEALRNVIER